MIKLFELGQVVATPGAIDAMTLAGDDPGALLTRHVSGDWGDLCAEDKAENEYSLDKRLRLMSAYELSDGCKVWVITEADRSATTFLLPHEY